MVAIAGDGTLDPNVRVRRVNQLLDRGVPVRSARCCIAACLHGLPLVVSGNAHRVWLVREVAAVATPTGGDAGSERG
jgi:hypothetical protein